jgi:predicted  nucleic acid-binding Zn-ribbon protein
MSSVKNDPIGGLFNSIGKSFDNTVKETGKLMTESINDIGKAFESGGFVGGTIKAFEEVSPGNFAAGAFDVLTGPGQLDPKVAAGISSVVNMAAGAAIPGAGLPLQLLALKDAAVAFGMIGSAPTTEQAPPANSGQQPESPSSAARGRKSPEELAALKKRVKEQKAKREERKEAIENAKAKARESMHAKAVENSKLMEKAEAAVARGGGYAEVKDILGDLAIFDFAKGVLADAKANDKARGKVDTMGGYVAEANDEIDKLLNNPNLSFEDMIFMIMQHFMKEQQTEVKNMTRDLRGQKDGFEADKVGMRADVDKAEADFAKAQAALSKDPSNEGLATAAAKAKADLRDKENTLNDATGDFQDSRAEKFELIKNAMNKLSEMQSTLSNILNAMHQTSMQTIGNIR